jgi:hypothetical protein
VPGPRGLTAQPRGPVWGGLWVRGLALWCAAWRCGPAGQHRGAGGEDGGHGCDERDLPAGHAACGGDADRGVCRRAAVMGGGCTDRGQYGAGECGDYDAVPG